MDDVSNRNLKKPRFLTIMSMLTAVLWIICLVSQTRLVALPMRYICAEIYGYKESRKVLWLAFICVWIFVLTVFFFTTLQPPNNLLSNAASSFNQVMQPLLRILIFNNLGFMVGQYINIYVFSKMRQPLQGRFFGL